MWGQYTRAEWSDAQGDYFPSLPNGARLLFQADDRLDISIAVAPWIDLQADSRRALTADSSADRVAQRSHRSDRVIEKIAPRIAGRLPVLNRSEVAPPKRSGPDQQRGHFSMMHLTSTSAQLSHAAPTFLAHSAVGSGPLRVLSPSQTHTFMPRQGEPAVSPLRQSEPKHFDICASHSSSTHLAHLPLGGIGQAFPSKLTSGGGTFPPT